MSLSHAEEPRRRVSFYGWGTHTMDFDPVLDEFRRRHPDIDLTWTPFPVNAYASRIEELVAAGDRPIDALWVRETHVARWAVRGIIRPLDEVETLDVDGIKRTAMPAAIEDGTYEGRLYGVPYYSSWTSFVVDRRVIERTGSSGPPRSWDELRSQLTAIKTAKLAEIPLTIPLRPSENWLEFPALVHASGGDMFDESDAPVFDRQDSVVREILRRLVELRQLGLLDARSVDLLNPETRDLFTSGRSAMTTVSAQYFALIMDPRASTVAADAQMADLPSLSGTMAGTVAFTRCYAIAEATRDIRAAGQLLQFMSFKDARGVYWNQEYILTTAGTLSAYPEVMYGERGLPVVRRMFRDPDLAARQQRLARPRQSQKTMWFAQWDPFFQERVREILLGETSIDDALSSAARLARDLRSGVAA